MSTLKNTNQLWILCILFRKDFYFNINELNSQVLFFFNVYVMNALLLHCCGFKLIYV